MKGHPHYLITKYYKLGKHLIIVLNLVLQSYHQMFTKYKWIISKHILCKHGYTIYVIYYQYPRIVYFT